MLYNKKIREAFKIVGVFLSATLLLSCEKQYIKPDKGAIDIITNIYYDASKNLDNMKSVWLSKINYKGDTIIEIVPNIHHPEIIHKIHYIKDTVFYDITEQAPNFMFSDLAELEPNSIFKKIDGALFTKDLKDFDNRKELNDTILFKKNYKRFEINNDELYSIFYIYETDTLLPYTVNPRESKKYNGRIERIDSYYKKKDMFISVQMLFRKKWDEEAEEIFNFNDFITAQKTQK